MLEKLLIQNFQCHEKLVVEFDPRVTTITGPSDSGKSAVLRALRWVMTNNPQGTAHVREGADFAAVRLIVDGRTIKRTRGKSKNEYKLDEAEYKAFGVDVPEPIAKLLNTQPINFQGQHDSPYWFSLSPGQVSRELNAIIDLGVIDDAMAAISAKVRTAQATKTVSEDRLKEADANAERLEWVVEAGDNFEGVAALEENHGWYSRQCSGLDRLVNEIRPLAAIRKKQKQKLKHLNVIAGLGATAAALDKRAYILAVVVSQIEEAVVWLNKDVADFVSLNTLMGIIVRTGYEIDAMYTILGKIEAAASRIKALRVYYTKKGDTLAEAKEGNCPVCGKELSDDE